MLLEFCLCFIVLSLSEAQTFSPFGSHEYYWPTNQEEFARGYEEARQQCSRLFARLAVVNDEAIGKYLIEAIGNVTLCKSKVFLTKSISGYN